MRYVTATAAAVMTLNVIGYETMSQAQSLPQPEAGHAELVSGSVKTQIAAKRLKVGMVVLGRQGAKLGFILRVSDHWNERPAVLIDINGARFKVQVSELRPVANSDEVILLLSPSRIRTRSILNID